MSKKILDNKKQLLYIINMLVAIGQLAERKVAENLLFISNLVREMQLRLKLVVSN